MELNQVYCKPGTLCSKYPLDKKKILKKTLQSTGIIIIIWIIILGTGFTLNSIVWWSILFLVIIISVTLYQMLYYKFYFYDMTTGELIIKKGVVSRREVVIPFSKIQDIYVDQDFLDRIFGLYDVHVATAATGGAYAGSERAHIDGVNSKNAEALKKIFIEIIRKYTGKSI
jgi:hypothetical protein